MKHLTLKSGDYLNVDLPLTEEEALPDVGGRGDEAPVLNVHVYYYKDGRPRGIKITISHVRVGNGFRSTQLMHPRNGYLNAVTLERKSDKVGERIAAVIEANLDTIKEIALENIQDDPNGKPDWSRIFDILSEDQLAA